MSAEIGVILRDTYGIPSVKALTKKSITGIMAEKKLAKSLPEDLMNLIRKAVELDKHFQENRQDKTALRGIQLTRSKIMRLVKYYKAQGVLDEDWKFNMAHASFYIE